MSLPPLPELKEDEYSKYDFYFNFSHSFGEVGKLSRMLKGKYFDQFRIFEGWKDSGKHAYIVELICANLIYSYLHIRMSNLLIPVKYNRGGEYWGGVGVKKTYGWISVGAPIFRKAIDWFIENGYVEEDKGYRNPEYEQGIASKMLPTEKFSNLIRAHYNHLIFELKKDPGKVLLKQRIEKEVVSRKTGKKKRKFNKLAKRWAAKDYNRKRVKEQEELLEGLNSTIRQHEYSYTFADRSKGKDVIKELLYPTKERLKTKRKKQTISNTSKQLITQHQYTLITVNRTQPELSISYQWDSDLRLKLQPEHILYNRVFNDNYHTGGRYYSPLHNLFREERFSLCIDGKQAVERDYSSLHPHMLYTKEGVQLEGKAYDIGLDEKHRPAIKKVLLSVFNCRTEEEAIKAAQSEINKDYSVRLEDGLTVKEIIDSLKERHKPLLKYFCSGIGRELQYWDSEIATCIIRKFIDAGKVILPVHDSFIVKPEDEVLLCEMMDEAYRVVMARWTKTIVKSAPKIDPK